MNEAKLKACACGARPVAQPTGENQWWIHCINAECPARPGSVAATYKQAASAWNMSAGDREPAVSKTPGESALAPRMCSVSAEDFWNRYAGRLAKTMKAGGVKSFRMEVTPRGTYEFEVIPAADTPNEKLSHAAEKE